MSLNDTQFIVHVEYYNGYTLHHDHAGLGRGVQTGVVGRRSLCPTVVVVAHSLRLLRRGALMLRLMCPDVLGSWRS